MVSIALLYPATAGLSLLRWSGHTTVLPVCLAKLFPSQGPWPLLLLLPGKPFRLSLSSSLCPLCTSSLPVSQGSISLAALPFLSLSRAPVLFSYQHLSHFVNDCLCPTIMQILWREVSVLDTVPGTCTLNKSIKLKLFAGFKNSFLFISLFKISLSCWTRGI